MVRVNKESLEKLDELVEAGIVNSRSEAAAFLIVEGTKARQGLFDRISSKIEEIRNAKQELKKLLEEDEDPSSDPAASE
jgi:Arc/MetJ-type ribon-helix-helix transcriptional regulator